LRQKLGSTFDSVFRTIRLMNLHQMWQLVLAKELANLLKLESKFSTAFEIEKILTYGKKEVFQRAFTSQKAISLIDYLYNKMEKDKKWDLSPRQILLEMRHERRALCKTLENNENKLKQKESLLQNVLANILLGIIEQPMYQLGYLAHQLGTDMLDKVSFLGPKVEENFARKWRHAQGATFLTLSFLAANWFSYSYHFIAAGNRFLFAHINWLFTLGNPLDEKIQNFSVPCIDKMEKAMPNYMRGVFKYIKDAIRLDELGVLEKEAKLQWLAGLCLNLVGSGFKNILPHTMGYSFGTAGASCADKLTVFSCQTIGMDEKTARGFGAIAHFFSYPYSYSLGYNTCNYLFPQLSYDTMTQSEALKIFGFLSNRVAEADIQKRFHKLSSEHHPDKCNINGNCQTAHEETTLINRAYATLIKKNQ
jgi:hypothetical protein